MTHRLHLVFLVAALAASACGSTAESSGAQQDAGVATPEGGVDELPCPVETVLKSRCQGCHGDPTANGAPFSLVTYADTQADYFGEPVWSRMRDAVESGFMPLAPSEPLSAQDKQTLLDWLGDGAKPATPGASCP